jgi:hypothetical protein
MPEALVRCVLQKRKVLFGVWMIAPSLCALCRVCERCWRARSEERPSFASLHGQLVGRGFVGGAVQATSVCLCLLEFDALPRCDSTRRRAVSRVSPVPGLPVQAGEERLRPSWRRHHRGGHGRGCCWRTPALPVAAVAQTTRMKKARRRCDRRALPLQCCFRFGSRSAIGLLIPESIRARGKEQRAAQGRAQHAPRGGINYAGSGNRRATN